MSIAPRGSLVLTFLLVAACADEVPDRAAPSDSPATVTRQTPPSATPTIVATETAPLVAPSASSSGESISSAGTPPAPTPQIGRTPPSAAPSDPSAPSAQASTSPVLPTGPVAGKPWKVVASADADAGYHCNADYPNKFTPKGGTNVTYPEAKVAGACAGDRVVATVPFVPTAAGPGTVTGTLSYGICDDKKTSCLMKKKDVTLAFTASP